MMEQSRTRYYSWTDPAIGRSRLGVLSGLDTLRALDRGDIPMPPILRTLDLGSLTADVSRTTVTMRVQEFHYNLFGVVHGGVIGTLLDTAAACAVHATLPADWGYTSMDLSTRFLRPATMDSGLLRCEGTVINRGRTTALAEAQLFDDSGKLLAHATSTCLLFPIPG